MSSLNKVQLIGRLGKDPESRAVNGKTVCNFSVACSEKFKNAQGQVVENTEWVNVVIWEKTADIAVKYLKKGDVVYLEGKIRTRTWEKDGVKHYATEVLVHNLVLLPNTRAQAQPTTYTPPAQDDQFGPPPSGSAFGNSSDDLPF